MHDFVLLDSSLKTFRVFSLLPDAFGSQGGISKFNRDLLSALCSSPRVEEVVAFPRIMHGEPGSLPAKLHYATDGLGSKFRYLAAVSKWASRGQDFSIILCGHINLLPSAFLARRMALLLNKRVHRCAHLPIVLFIHGLDAWEPHRSALVRLLARRVDAFISVSEFTKQRFVSWSHIPVGKGHLLPNSVDLSAFTSGPKDPALLKRYGLEGKKILLTLGRLVPGRPKGIEEVLEQLPDLARTVSGIAYLIVGDGPDRPRLEQKAQSLGLSVFDATRPHHNAAVRNPQSAVRNAPQVVFAGRVSESEKAAHYRIADTFIMPGYGEGFGIVYLEALACGIPVLASTLDASREALRDCEMGVMVDPRDRSALRQGILRALKCPRGKAPAGLDYFSFSTFVKRCHLLLDDLCPAAATCS